MPRGTDYAVARTDCFAYKLTLSSIAKPQCEALNELECVKGNGECPFYKKRTSYLTDLLNRHGTDNIDFILNRYAKRKEQKEGPTE